jgi:hypothetical protein
LVALLATIQAKAQFSMGVKGGANFTQLTMGNFITTRLNANGTPAVSVNGQMIKDNINASLNSRSGFVGGVWMRLGDALYIQPEVIMSTKNGSFDIIQDGKVNTVDMRITNVDVPVLVGMKAKFLRFNLGPMASFMIGNDENLQSALKKYTTGGVENALAKAVWGYQIGGGLDLGGISLDVRYEGALSDVSALNLSSTAGSNQFSQRTRSWQATLAFKLF